MSALSPQSSKLAFVFAAGLGCVTACMCGRCIFTENKIRWTHVMDGIRKYQSIRSHSIVFKMECQCRYRLCYYIRTSTNEIEIRRYESHGKWTVASRQPNGMLCDSDNANNLFSVRKITCCTEMWSERVHGKADIASMKRVENVESLHFGTR